MDYPAQRKMAIDHIKESLKMEAQQMELDVEVAQVDDGAGKRKKSSFWGSVKKFKPSSVELAHDRVLAHALAELDRYLDDDIMDHEEDPRYWAQATRFPTLQKIVPKFLCVMATSVPSERLFSDAAHWAIS